MPKAQENKKLQLMTPTQIAQVVARKFDSSNLERVLSFVLHDITLDPKRLSDQVKANKDKPMDEDAKAVWNLAENLVYALEHSDEPESQAFMNSVKFMAQYRNVVENRATTPVYAMSFISQIDKLVEDKQVKFDLLNHMIDVNLQSPEATKLLIQLLVKNGENAPIEAWQAMLERVPNRHDIETAFTLFEQMEKAAARELQSELGKLPYDIQKISDICQKMARTAGYIAQSAWAGTDRTTVTEWQKNIREKYDLQRIIAANMEQIEQLPQSGYVRADKLESQVAELNRRIAELESQLRAKEQEIQQMSQNHEQAIKHKDDEIRASQEQANALRQQISGLQSQNADLVGKFTASKQKLKKLADAASSMQVGPLASRSAKEVRELASAMVIEETQESR